MRRFGIAALVCAALSLAACGATTVEAPPSTPGAVAVVAPTSTTVLEATAITDQGLHFGYQALDTIASVVDSLVTAGVIKHGSPKAKVIADAFETTLKAFNTASALQRQVGRAADAYAAWQQAQAGLANLRAALAQK